MKAVESIKNTKRQRELRHVTDMSDDELKSLARRDPFLYYSIPGAVRSARPTLPLDESNDMDTTNRGPNHGASRLLRRCTTTTSLPSSLRKLRMEQQARDATVKRRNTISYECHPDCLLFDDYDLGWDEDDDDGILDLSP